MSVENREAFKKGGFRGRRSGRMGSVKGARSRSTSTSTPSGFKGNRSARGASVKGETSRSRSRSTTSDAKTSSTKKDRSRELKALDKIRFDKKTAFQTKKGFLKDKFGNIVRSKKQVDRFNKQKALTDFKRKNPNLVEERQSLLDKAKKNKISNTELDRLGILNQQFQKNPTIGMGPIESARYQFTNQQFKDDLAKARKTFSEIPTPFNLAKRLATGIVGKFAPKTQVAEAQAIQAQQPDVYGLDALASRFNQGGRVQMGHGGMMPMSGMMMSQSPTVIMNVANSGIGGILDKFKQIRSEM
jgi:hypothetical protein